YLRGEWRTHGWWYYYLYATVVKEPLPFLALGILAVMAGVLLVKWTRAGICDAIHLLMPGMALFAFVSSQTGFNHHLRYVLPAFPFFAIGIGVLGSQEVRQFRWLYRLSFGLAILGSLASVSISPHWHAFFNVTVGGPQNGPFHLLDSNVDWGQDVLLFKRWVQSHPELPLDGVEYALPAWLGVRSLAGIDSGFVPKGYDQTQKKPDSSGGNSDTGPSPGRYALSVIPIYREDSGYDYFQRIEPIARVGWTIRVYELTQSDTDQIRDSLGYEPLKRDQILK
ncbi:MAG: hypothetical protein KDA80_21945, partial [Planctomycetaceae bacterium]|nr:hypothetical protein [Planctomycetaceae bacterium]